MGLSPLSVSRKGMTRSRPVDGGGGGKSKSWQGLPTAFRGQASDRRIQQGQGAVHVDIVVDGWIIDRGANARHGRQMGDRINIPVAKKQLSIIPDRVCRL